MNRRADCTVRLVLLARLKETLGVDSEQLMLPDTVVDVAGLTQWLRQRGDNWAEELAVGRSVRVAVNQEMAQPTTPIRDGDEVALFPPVTGG